MTRDCLDQCYIAVQESIRSKLSAQPSWWKDRCSSCSPRAETFTASGAERGKSYKAITGFCLRMQSDDAGLRKKGRLPSFRILDAP